MTQISPEWKAERAFLGACLLGGDPLLLDPMVSPSDFDSEVCSTVYAAILKLRREGKRANIVSVTQEIQSDPKIANPWALPVELAEGASATDLRHMARMVRDNAIRRAYLAAGGDVARLAETITDGDELRGAVEGLILGVGNSRAPSVAPVALGDAVNVEVARLDEPTRNGLIGIPTGYRKLDWLIGGWQPKRLYTIVGRPGSGKTSLALSHTLAAAQAGHKVHWFTLEMGADELAIRTLGQLAVMDTYKITRREVRSDDPFILHAAKSAQLPVTFDEGIFDFDQILSRMRRMARQDNIRFFVIDHLLLIQSKGRYEREDLRIANITGSLKAFCKQTQSAVLLLNQFNKENRNEIPHNGNIRGGATVENDSDFLELLYSPIEVGEVDELERYQGLTFGNVTKNRGGQAFVRLEYHFDKPTTTYREWHGGEIHTKS